MLQSDVAQKVIDCALSYGANFCDIFVENSTRQTIQILSSEVNEINSGIDFGIGVRLIYGNDVVYGYTNSKIESDLLTLTEKLGALYKKSAVAQAIPLVHKSLPNIHTTQFGLINDIDLSDKIQLLNKIDGWVRSAGEKITQANIRSIQKHQRIQVFNSEGLDIEDERNYTRFAISAIATDGKEQHSAFEGPGSLGGWEFSQKVPLEEISQTVAKVALDKLTAHLCPAGKFPVVIDSGFGGVIFHEACGHLLETTSIAKKASVFHDKMGQQIASSVISASDDGTIANEWGSITCDDEGMPTQNTKLIDKGKMVGILSDRLGAIKCDIPRTGSARRESYKYAPTSRMRNTFIEPGSSTLDEMISSIDYGIYCRRMGGGSVTPGTGEFNFAADESFLIENGKISKTLKSSTLIGKGAEILQKISMVGNNLALSAGMCGSVSGAVPVTVGQPAIKVDEILVGGQDNA